MIFAVPATASAYNTYVGLKIESVNNPNVGSPTEWCLPSGITTMTINDGSEDIDTVTTSSDTCPGDTIWSGLVSLTALSYYTVGIESYHTHTNTHEESGYIWVGPGPNGHSCDTYCEYLEGTCVDPGNHDTDLGCDEIKMMTGSTLPGGCEGRSGDYEPCYRSDMDKAYRPGTAGNYTCTGTGYQRFCTCEGVQLAYTFNFRAP